MTRKKQRVESIDYIVLEAKMPAAYAAEISGYLKERDLVARTYRQKQNRYDLEKDQREVFDRHEFMRVFRKSFENTNRIPFDYQNLIQDAVISALEVLHTDEPAEYNDVISIVEELFRNHRDGCILPNYSKELGGLTRNVALGGGVYELQVHLPHGKKLNLIAKQFASSEDFDTEVRATEELGETILATDSSRRVKIEFNKGKTTLAEKLRDSPQDLHYESLVEVSKAVIRELQWAGEPGKFEKKAGRLVKGVTYLSDIVRGKKHNRGKFYKIDEVSDFTEDFFDRFVFRLGGELAAKVRKDPDDKKSGISKKKIKEYSALNRLYRVLKKEVEPLFGKQNTQPLNPDLNGGNVLFDNAGNIRMIDRESMRVDHVQKCVYDLVEKRRLPLDQEKGLAQLFHEHLDTGVDEDTFFDIYLVRRVLEDLAFTKYLEYSKTRVSAQDPSRAGRFEDLALYYYNRAIRLASDDDVPLSKEFIGAVGEAVDIMGINDKLRLIPSEEFEELEARVATYHESTLSVGPMEKLQGLRAHRVRYSNSDDSVSALQFLWGKILAGSLAAGLLAGGTCGGFKGCDRMLGPADTARTPTTYLKNAHSALRTGDFNEEAMKIIESRKPCNVRSYRRKQDIKERYRLIESQKHYPIKKAMEKAYEEYGVSKRLLHSILFTNHCNGHLGWESDKVGPMHVPSVYIEENIVGDYQFIQRKRRQKKSPNARSRDQRRRYNVKMFADGRNHLEAAARYLKDCEMSQDGNVVNTIADYYLGPRKLQKVIAEAGTTSYFDVEENGKTVSGYRRFLSSDNRKLVETALHLYLHTNNSLGYYRNMVYGHGKK